MDSPVIEKKYSSASQKYVGNNTQQSIQRHNFLVPKEEQPQLNPPYRGDSRKSPLKPHSRKQDTSINYKNRGYSTEKQILNFGAKNDSYENHHNIRNSEKNS